MRFPKQEYRSGLPLPSPGDLPDPGIKATSLASPALAGEFFATSATWEALGRHTELDFHWTVMGNKSSSQITLSSDVIAK